MTTKKLNSLFQTWLDLNGFDENELDTDSLCYVYAQLENGVSPDDVEYFG